jgi:hypothetical protein
MVTHLGAVVSCFILGTCAWLEVGTIEIEMLLYSRLVILLFHFLRLLFDGCSDAIQFLDTKFVRRFSVSEHVLITCT